MSSPPCRDNGAEPVNVSAVQSAVALVAELLKRLAAGGGIFARFDIPEVQQGTRAWVRIGLVAPNGGGIRNPPCVPCLHGSYLGTVPSFLTVSSSSFFFFACTDVTQSSARDRNALQRCIFSFARRRRSSH